MKSCKWFFVLVSALVLFCVQNVSAKNMSNADLNGRYIVGSVTMDIINGFATDLFQLDANGSGTYDYLYLYSSSEEGGESGSSNYTVSLDGELTILVESLYKMVGGISSDGQYFSVTWHETGAEPSIVFGIKESTGASVANLNGTYDMYSVLFEDNQLDYGEFVFFMNGSGNWYYMDGSNENGTYSVDSKGHVTFNFLQHKGMVSNDGNVFFVVSTNKPILEIIIGIRRSTGMSISDFTGNYHYTEWGFDYSLVNNYLKSISIGKDSIFAYQDLFNTSSLPLKSGEVNISTNSNGSFNSNNGFTGTLSADGNVFAMNGNTGSYNYLGVGITKSSEIDLAPKPNIIPIISLLLEDEESVNLTCDSNDILLCDNSSDCVAVGGYWWSDNVCRGVPESETVVSAGNRIWMDRNLGASQVATSLTDEAAYGDLYQWGRDADGHQLRTSVTTSVLSTSDDPGHGDFITTATSPYDWRVPQNDNLWQGESNINNPCPAGFRLPTWTELNTERNSWSSQNIAGMYLSPLKLVIAGFRSLVTGRLVNDGRSGYWTSTRVTAANIQQVRILRIQENDAFMNYDYRALGLSARCIQDQRL